MKIGDKVYLMPMANAARFSNEMKEDFIENIGRKYFKTKRHGRFYIDNMTQENGKYMSNYKAFFKIEDYHIYLEIPKIKRHLIYEIERTNDYNLLKNLKEMLPCTK